MSEQKVLLVVSEQGQSAPGWAECLNQLKLLPQTGIHILYVVPDMPSQYCVLPSVAWLSVAWMDDAHTTLHQLRLFYGVDHQNIAIAQGHPYKEALRYASQKGCQRVVGDLTLDLSEIRAHSLWEQVKHLKMWLQELRFKHI